MIIVSSTHIQEMFNVAILYTANSAFKKFFRTGMQ